ncbi:unnamed protein product [Rotaria socialis]|uniref:Uncharacterized protein n=1 Tax=Rotaria socialis TaxID=392032 RepID=A0A820YZ79_9BILA|nr:unnamed protein product [Rotaria socialis]
MIKMASNQQDYFKQLELLQEHPHDVDKVFDCVELSMEKSDPLEVRYGTLLTTLQQEYPTIQSVKRSRLLRMMHRFGGDVERIRKNLQEHQEKQNAGKLDLNAVRHPHQEEIKAKYASQLVELKAAGINTNNPCVLQQLEKYHGDTNKILEKIKHRAEKKDHITQLDTRYSSQLAQLESDGVKTKNKRLLIELLEKANGQIDVVKQMLTERKEQKDQIISSTTNTAEEYDEKLSSSKKHLEIDIDDIDHLRQLRNAGVHGNPMKILALFHECNQSIERTVVRYKQVQEQREKESEKRTQQRISLAEIHNAYLTLDNQNDWPNNIQKVYLDGNNMMFVIDSLRRLCLNQSSKEAERAIAEIAAAWNKQMLIPHVELIFDFTQQLEPIDSIKVSSARPTYKTTDEMLIDIAQRSQNYHTIVVTSDRNVSIHLKRQGCQLVKPYQWFAHCAMLLTSDLIMHEDKVDMTSTTTITKNKIRYDLNGLARRIAKIDL